MNSEIPAGGLQKKWFKKDLQQHRGQKLTFVQYHKPMRPHYRYKTEWQDEYKHWAPLFTQYKINLAIECDSHLMKMTWPLVYDPQGVEGFSRVKDGGTIFIGEGGWGAPLRKVNDRKSWTRIAERMNHIFSIKVHANAHYDIQPLSIPSAIKSPLTPQVLSLDFKKIVQFTPVTKHK